MTETKFGDETADERRERIARDVSHAEDYVTGLKDVRTGSKADAWVTFTADSNESYNLAAYRIAKHTKVSLWKADPEDGFLSARHYDAMGTEAEQ